MVPIITDDHHDDLNLITDCPQDEKTAATDVIPEGVAYEVNSYRPLKSILKSSSGASAANTSSEQREAECAQILNRNSPKRSGGDTGSTTTTTESIRLSNIAMHGGEDSNGDDFVGEFTPRRAKGDIEAEPLLAADADDDDDGNAPTITAGVNKAYARDEDQDGDDLKRQPSNKKKVVAYKASEKYGETEAEESSLSILFQVSLPFFIAGCGTVGAGLVLDKVQHHRVFEEVPQIFILVPALLGLKGNLEMTLASRLSTLANLGRMDTKKEKMQQVIGNLALIQAQAAVIAFLAAASAIIFGWIPKGEFQLDHALILCASSLATASLASLILGSIMIAVVFMSKSLNINPDNVATPIAASLGDLTTLSLLAAAGSLLINATDNGFWLAPFIVAIFILLCPLWMWLSARNPVTREVLISGWSPIIVSMLISSAGGFILEYAVRKYHGIAVFQPVINGIGGNLVAVQASRISTSLHRVSRLGTLPSSVPAICFNPCRAFFGINTHSKAARVLLLLVVPGHLAFIFMIHYLRAGHTPITPTFATLYCAAAVIQVFVLLYVCVIMVNSMWKRKIDPDNSAIPYLTALGDLLGTALLAIAFHILYALGDREATELGDGEGNL